MPNPNPRSKPSVQPFDGLRRGASGRRAAPEPKEKLVREAVPQYLLLASEAGGGQQDRKLVTCAGRWAERWALRSLRSLQPAEIHHYLGEIRRHGTDTDARREQNFLSSFFRWALRKGWAELDPTCAPEPGEAPAATPTFWSAQDQDRLLLACHAKWQSPGQGAIVPPRYLFPLVLLGLRTGLTLTQLVELRWSQVDLDGRWLRIPLPDAPDTCPFAPPPAPRHLRARLTEGAKKCLEGLHAGSNHRILNGHRLPNGSSVLEGLGLPGDLDEPDVHRVDEDLGFACKRASVPPGGFHSLRFCFAANLARAGMSWTTVAPLLGGTEEETALEAVFLEYVT